MDVADLVGVHEARVAHHVAAVGQVDGEHGAAAVLDGGSAVVVDIIGHHLEVPPGKKRFHALQEAGIHGHHVLELTMLGTGFDHPHLIVTLDDARLDFARIAVDEHAIVLLTGKNRLAHFLDTPRTEGIRFAGETQSGSRHLVGLLKVLRGPFRLEGLGRQASVEHSCPCPDDLRHGGETPPHGCRKVIHPFTPPGL